MARLPDATALGPVPDARSGRPISMPDLSGYARGAAAMAEGIKDIGSSISKFGNAVVDAQQIEAMAPDDLKAARLVSAWSTAKLDTSSAIRSATDYEPAETSDGEGVAAPRPDGTAAPAGVADTVQPSGGRLFGNVEDLLKHRDALLAGIGDPQERELFRQRSDGDIAALSLQAKAKADELYGVKQLAYLGSAEDDVIKKLLGEDDEGLRADALSAHRRHIHSYVQKGWLSEPAAAEWDQKFKNKYAEAFAIAHADKGNTETVITQLEAASLNAAQAGNGSHYNVPGDPTGEGAENPANRVTTEDGAELVSNEAETGPQRIRYASLGSPLAPAEAKPKPLPPIKIIDKTSDLGFGTRFGTFRQGVKGFIIHHTDGRPTVDGVISTFKARNYPTHFVIDRDGKVYQTLPDGAQGQHIKNGQGIGKHLNNSNAEGVEIIAKDDNDVTPAQIDAAIALVEQRAARWGFDPVKDVFGHGEVNRHKQRDEGATVLGAILARRRREDTTSDILLDSRVHPKIYGRRDPSRPEPGVFDAMGEGPRQDPPQKIYDKGNPFRTQTIFDTMEEGPRLALLRKMHSIRAAQAVDAARQIELAKKQAAQLSDKEESALLTHIFSDNPAVTAKDVVNNGQLTPEARGRTLGILSRADQPDPLSKLSRATAIGLLDRLHLPEDDPDRLTALQPIYDEYLAGRLNRADFELVRKEFNAAQTPEGSALAFRKQEFLESVKPLIDKSDPGTGVSDEDGAQRFYQLHVDLSKQIEEYRKAGKNPDDLLNPAKPDFMGKPDALLRYQPKAEGGEAVTAKARGLWDRAQQDPERFVEELINNPSENLKDIDVKDAAIVAGLAALLVVGKGAGKRLAGWLMGRLGSRPAASESKPQAAKDSPPNMHGESASSNAGQTSGAPTSAGVTSGLREAAGAAIGRLADKDESETTATRSTDNLPSQPPETTPSPRARGQEAEARRQRIREFSEGQRRQSLDVLLDRAKNLQRDLVDTGSEIAAATGAEFIDPGVKKTEEAVAKLSRDRSPDPSSLTDLARVGYLVKSPAHADAVAAEIKNRFDSIDLGWTQSRSGYRDRKLIVRGADGTVGEVQMMPRPIYEAKEDHGGHDLYKQQMKLPGGHPQRKKLAEDERKLYIDAMPRMGPEWDEIYGQLRQQNLR